LSDVANVIVKPTITLRRNLLKRPLYSKGSGRQVLFTVSAMIVNWEYCSRWNIPMNYGWSAFLGSLVIAYFEMAIVYLSSSNQQKAKL
jgi:hypothetical protein